MCIKKLSCLGGENHYPKKRRKEKNCTGSYNHFPRQLRRRSHFGFSQRIEDSIIGYQERVAVLTRIRLLMTVDSPAAKLVHTRRALSSTVIKSHQETVSGQACNPPDPHWYFSFTFGGGVLRYPVPKRLLFLNYCGEWFFTACVVFPFTFSQSLARYFKANYYVSS